MSHTTYLIRLRPLDYYFFGGENTFGEGDSSNYFAVSNPLPQQTSLLGMLRQQVLFQNRGKAHGLTDQELIGPESFKADGKIDNFGAIKGISPLVFAQEKGNHGKTSLEFWLPQSKEYCYPEYEEEEKKGELEEKELVFDGSKKGAIHFSNSTQKQLVPLLQNYDPKAGLPDLLVSLDGSRKMKVIKSEDLAHENLESGILRSVLQVGIDKQKLLNTRDDEGGFFKKTSYSMEKGWGFAFFVRLDSGIRLENDLITMGGERSPFNMSVTKWEGQNPLDNEGDFFSAVYNLPNPDVAKLVCISDCILDDSIFQNCLFANAEVGPFRNTRSRIGKTQNYSRLGFEDNPTQPWKTSRIHIVRKGTVLYFSPDQEESIKNAFHRRHYRKAGFNFFKMIHPKNN